MENRKLKIVVTALVPRSVDHIGKTGGLSRLAQILKRFSDFEDTRIILVSSDKSYQDYFAENGITAEFKFVKSNLNFKSLLGLCVKSLLILIKSLFSLKLDFLESRDEKVVVYSSSDLFWEVIPAYYFKSKKKNIEWVQVIHHVYPDWKKRSGKRMENFFGYWAQGFSFWLIKRKADKIILVNSMVKEKLIELGFLEKKILVSSNGVNSKYFENIGRSGFSYEGVFLGRLNHSKGLGDLIEIWKKVCQKLPGAKLAVIGGGNNEMKNFMMKNISNNKLERNIDLLGFLKDEKAYPILKSGKVFLFPSHEEGWGIAIAEAMACKLPVISWDLPNFKSVFENYTLQIKGNDFNLFSKKIIEILSDEKLRKKIGEESREFIRKYSWENVAEKEYEIICRQ